jgi:hypothetical protein
VEHILIWAPIVDIPSTLVLADVSSWWKICKHNLVRFALDCSIEFWRKFTTCLFVHVCVFTYLNTQCPDYSTHIEWQTKTAFSVEISFGGSTNNFPNNRWNPFKNGSPPTSICVIFVYWGSGHAVRCVLSYYKSRLPLGGDFRWNVREIRTPRKNIHKCYQHPRKLDGNTPYDMFEMCAAFGSMTSSQYSGILSIDHQNRNHKP